MKHWNRRIALGLIFSLLITGCALSPSRGETVPAPDSRMPAVIDGQTFCLNRADGSKESVFLNGVNMGAAAAGSFPGEFAVPKETYLRWFQYISDMNVQVVRVYVNQMPAFYEALAEFNAKAEKPLYLIQGVYADEDMIAAYGNAFGGNGAFLDSFFSDIRNAVDMIHGSAEIEKLPGHAGGSYMADVSPYVIAWILGIEWEAGFVNGTNAAEPDRTSYEGKYVRTADASPFETFLAEAAETAISRDLEVYGSQRPVALCNWCTTDPLDHPNEPSPEMEDAAVVNAEHILATDAFQAGFFASYHVYPYYPEFLSYDQKYLEGEEPNPYLAYLKELVRYHTVPVLISEYGIPASRGIAHENAVTGMTQGYASERQQAEWLMSMCRDIREAGCIGGLIFTWQDEWFKRTWNSMDYEQPDRRPFWYNALSPEECFGLMAFTTGGSVVLDGKDGDWRNVAPVAENDGMTVYAQSDAGYLYLMVRAKEADFERDTLYLPLGVASDLGSHGFGSVRFSRGAEFLLQIHGREDTRLLVDAHYDAFYYSYAHQHTFFPQREGQYERDSGQFGPYWMAMNRPMLIPGTGETVDFSRFDAGLLRYGCTDTKDDGYDSLADFCFGKDFVELRLPWMMIGFMDPSTKQVMDDLYKGDTITPVSTDGVRIGVCRADSKNTAPMELYTWENWELPETGERLKASYYLLKDYFAAE